jgi:caffeoyl-CoA O-methyltransferase
MTAEEYAQMVAGEDEVLLGIRQEIRRRGLPEISVAAELGKLLYLLVRISGARRVLEIGALGGYSGVWLARALPPGGTLVSLELEAERAALARESLARAGLDGRGQWLVGEAEESLKELARRGDRFDLVFIDADKERYPSYLELSLALARPGTVICADNVLWHGRVLDPADHSPGAAALRVFHDQLRNHPRLEATFLTGRDGFAIARVTD